MAKRMKSKIQPAELTMNFVITPEGAPKESFFLDLSQCASILNRRFYRQGLNWAVSSFKFLSPAGTTGDLQIQKLPNTWVMSNAWEKGFRAWKRQQDDAIDDGDQQSVKAKYNDFKIFANTDHHSAGFSANLLPISGATLANPVQTATAGEWEASQIVIPNYVTVGTNYEPFIQAVGDDVAGAGGTISLIKAYEDSRGVPQSPDPAVPAGVTSADNIYRAMFDVGDNMEDVMENVVGKNNDLPYPQENYPGGDTQLNSLVIHDNEFVTATTVGGTTHMKGGNFPCGLISINLANYSGSSLFIQINLVPGSHRGYLAESMTEM